MKAMKSTIKKFQKEVEYLDFLATGEKGKFPDTKDVHNLVVYLLTHPTASTHIEKLKSYVVSKDYSKTTMYLIEAIKTLDTSSKMLDENKGIRFPNLEALALLTSYQAPVKFMYNANNPQSLVVSFSSVVDFLYGNKSYLSVKAHDWIVYLLDKEGVDATSITRFIEYPDDLELTIRHDHHLGNSDISKEEIGNYYIDALAARFNKLFLSGKNFIRVINETTAFSEENHYLASWINSARFIFRQDNVNFLFLVSAIQDELEMTELFFEKPLIPYTDAALRKSSRPLLNKIVGTSPQSRELIMHIFFELINIPSKNLLGEELASRYYVLRSQREMVDLVNNLSPKEKDVIKSVNFRKYLESMGFKDSNQSEIEFVGVNGLKKSVQIHSLKHINFGGGYSGENDLYPPFVSLGFTTKYGP